MNPLEIVLAVVIIVGVTVQVVILALLIRPLSKFLVRADRLLDTIEPEVKDMATAVRTVRVASEITAREVAVLVSTVRATTDELTEIVRTDSREISKLIHRTIGVAERQVDEVDRTIDSARDRVTDIGYRFDRTVLEPARIVLAIGVGIRKGIEAILGGGSGRGRRLESDEDGRHP